VTGDHHRRPAIARAEDATVWSRPAPVSIRQVTVSMPLDEPRNVLHHHYGVPIRD
jgi:hypothetical protein